MTVWHDSYYGADPSDDRGGFGSYSTEELLIPVLAVSADPATDFMIKTPIKEWFTSSSSSNSDSDTSLERQSPPIIAITLRNTNHFSMKHVEFGLPYMNAFFSLYLNNNNNNIDNSNSSDDDADDSDAFANDNENVYDVVGYDYAAARTLFGDQYQLGTIKSNHQVKLYQSIIDPKINISPMKSNNNDNNNNNNNIDSEEAIGLKIENNGMKTSTFCVIEQTDFNSISNLSLLKSIQIHQGESVIVEIESNNNNTITTTSSTSTSTMNHNNYNINRNNNRNNNRNEKNERRIAIINGDDYSTAFLRI